MRDVCVCMFMCETEDKGTGVQERGLTFHVVEVGTLLGYFVHEGGWLICFYFSRRAGRTESCTIEYGFVWILGIQI